MRTFLVAFALSLVASLLLTRLVRDLAIRFKLYDEGGGRKIHQRPIPRMGGVAVALSFALPLLGLVLYHNDISRQLALDSPLRLSLLAGGGIMLAVGLVDDIRGTRAIVKLAGQIAAAVTVWSLGIQIEAVSIPFLGPMHLGLLSLPATVFWMVLVMNAINLIDGMDGLAGGVVVLAGGTLFVMSVIEDNALAALLLASAVGATLGFLAYNVHPATIFLGDTGSLFLGFLLALLSVHSSQKSYTLFSIIAAFLALGLPIFDLGMAIVRRYLSGQPIFRADQHHVHHILLRKGFTQSQSVVVLFAGAVLLEGAALTFIYADDAVSALVIVALVPLLIVSVRMLGYHDIIRSARRARAMEHVEGEANSHLDRVLRARDEMAAAESLDGLWSALCAVAHDLRLEHVELELAEGADFSRAERARPFHWYRSGGQRPAGVHHQTLISRELVLKAGTREIGVLRLSSFREDEVFGPMNRALGQLLADGVSLGLDCLSWRRRVSGLDARVSNAGHVSYS